MYKLFENYTDTMSSAECTQKTMENIKSFICDIAPKEAFTATSDMTTPIPDGIGLSDQVIQSTPLIFYSDVVDNSSPVFCDPAISTFKISDIANMEYPVYRVKYAWMPVDLIIFVPSAVYVHECDTSNLSYDFDNGVAEVSVDYICIAFGVDQFNVPRTGVNASTFGIYSEYVYKQVTGNRVADYSEGLRFSDCVVSVMPVLAINLQRGASPQFAMSLHAGVLSFFQVYFQSGYAESSADWSFVAPLKNYVIKDNDLANVNHAVICKPFQMWYLYGRKLHYISCGTSSAIAVLGACVDSNVSTETLNLYSEQYAFNWNSYRNVSAFCNSEKVLHTKAFKTNLDDTNLDKWHGNLNLTVGWKVPTLTISTLFPASPHIPLIDSAGQKPVPYFPQILNYPPVQLDIAHSYLFPTQSSNCLNNHFIAYPCLVYVNREPLDLGTVSLYCRLDFLLYSQRLYDDDDRVHEYNYGDKIYLGISNRHSCVLFLVDEREEAIT